ncbi:MAG: ABC transporter ATP-binding protein [Bellilinea sp.]
METTDQAAGERSKDFIRLEKLTKHYREGGQERMILQDADLAIPRGQFLAILGKSGSGKTTLLNLISGIDRADAGEIYVSGERLTGLKEPARTLFRRERIGFIFQFFNLIPTLTVWENVVLPLDLTGKLNGQGNERAAEMLEAVGLLNRRGAFPDRLSGGEQQRVAIARALVHDPLVVLADEPTGNLDEETGKSILALVDGLTRGAGKNLILVTHSAEAAGYADRVVTLRDGKFDEPHIPWQGD